MPPVQLPLAPAQLHSNQQLFADYYLDQILPQRADWQLLLAEAAAVRAEQATPAQARTAEANALERRLAALVNAAYGLSAADVELLWRTAPPRMPVGK